MMTEYAPYIATGAALLAGVVYLKTRGSGPIKPGYEPSSGDFLSSFTDGGKVFDVNVNGKMPIRLAKKGPASIPPLTIPKVFEMAVSKKGDLEALRWEDPSTREWKVWTWRQYYDACRSAAKSFIALGLQQFESVNIIGFNSPEWFFCNNGAVLAGAKSAGIYTTNGPDACQYITDHSEARVVVVENEVQLEKFLKVWGKLPRLRAIVVYQAQDESVNKSTQWGNVYSWSRFLELGKSVSDEELAKRGELQDPGHCCLLIYTSGTTGPPKAVMISQDNIFFTAMTLLYRVGEKFGQGNENLVSYLPLSHIAAQMVDVWLPLFLTAYNPGYATCWFARPDALKGSLANTLRAARPTYFFGVPRVWEKMMESMKAVGLKNSNLKKKLSAWARGCGGDYWREQQVGGTGAIPLGYLAAKKVIFSKVREALGLTRCRYQFVGAAPLARDVFEFFQSLDLPIFEIYGMSECTGPQTGVTEVAYKLGSTGISLAGTELKIDHVPGRDKPNEGEICYRGRHIMMGYMKQLDKTRETIDPQGFLHSGDVGKVDEFGFLSITGRIKELIITAGGENIAPVPIEDAIKSACPALSNVMMVGDRRKYNVCLVTLRVDMDEHGHPTSKLAGEAKTLVKGVETVEAAMKSEEWKNYIQKGIDSYNKQAVSQAQKIQKFAILPVDFSLAHELTPTLKLKRDVAAERHRAIIESLYDD